jgi:hypothetical protein
MRPSAATIALDEGIALAVVQEMLGFAGIAAVFMPRSCRKREHSSRRRIRDSSQADSASS